MPCANTPSLPSEVRPFGADTGWRETQQQDKGIYLGLRLHLDYLGAPPISSGALILRRELDVKAGLEEGKSHAGEGN